MMLHPKNLHISDFTYDLPDEKIAKYPLPERDTSKLLVYNQGQITESVFSKIADHLPANALMVFNNSKVIQSRITFKKPTGGIIEIFILEPCSEYGDITTAMKSVGCIRCQCLVGGAKKWKNGKLLATPERAFQNRDIENIEPVFLHAEMIEKKEQEYIIEFTWEPEVDFATALEIFGSTPIPPYLNRVSDDTDKERYQTIYAKEDGSVAAPTAGLHFTNEVMTTLKSKNISHSYVTLHVGAGTFKPVKSETIYGHDMHAEFLMADVNLIEKLLESTDVISVGTTSMRTIESLYWMGVKAFLNPDISVQDLEIKQWEVYDHLLLHHLTKKQALDSLLKCMKKHKLQIINLRTQILIAPGYTPKIATALVTNFHQPQSTLLLLIAALTGNNWKDIYHYALANNFRFLSYGDSCLIKW